MTWSTQADLPLPAPASAGGAPGAAPGLNHGNRRPWRGVSFAKGAQHKGQALAAHKSSRLSNRPKPTHRTAAPRDLLTYVALADVSPEVRDALASFGRTIEAGFLARQRPETPREAWWNRD